jgi:glycosyltransferase involved in cell wall biosynthesis
LKHYLFINQYVTQLYIDVLNVFADKGQRVTLLTGEVIPSGKPLSDNVEVVYFTPYRRNRAVSRIATWLWFARQAMRYVRSQAGDAELVLSTNPPLLLPLMANLLQAGHFRYHLIIYDLYPDALANHWSGRNGWLRRWWSVRNKAVMARAASLITIGEKMKSALGRYIDGDLEHVHVVPCWADLSSMGGAPGIENPFVLRYGLQDRFVVLYSGNLGATHDFDTLLKAAPHLKGMTDIHFVVIGDGAQKGRVAQLVRRHGLPNVTLLPFQEPAMLPWSFGAADIGVVSQGEGAELFSVPSKTYYYMAAGAAILGITGQGSELEQITDQYENGRVVRHGAWQEVQEFILQLHDDREALQRCKQNSLHAATHFTPENATTIYRIIAGTQTSGWAANESP